MIPDTLPGMREMQARVMELEEALRIQKEEAKQKGEGCMELETITQKES